MGVLLSIIIPAYNERECIGNLLASINECFQGTSLNYETIVVNNGSSDDTGNIALKYPCVVYEIDRFSVAYARNYGVSRSVGKVVAFLDADVRLTKSWVDELVKELPTIESCDIMTGARCSISDSPCWIERHWFGPLSAKSVGYINGANIVLSRVVFTKIGGFDLALETGEDYEFSMRAKAKDIHVVLNDRLKVIHDGFPATIKGFFKREIWHGKGDFSSFSAFIASNVAQLALLFGCLHLVLFASFIIPLAVSSSLFILILIVVLAVLMAVRVFYSFGLGLVIQNIPLAYVYLLARSYSLVAVLFDKAVKQG